MQLTLPKLWSPRGTRSARRGRGFLFGLPKHLEASILGLDISDRSFKYVELKKGRTGREIARHGRGAIPEGTIVQGVVKDIKAFSDVLREEIGPTRAQVHAAFSLPEELGFTRAITLPKMLNSEIRSALSLQLEEHVPLSSAEAAFDFEILETSNRDVINIVFAAFPQQVVESYASAIALAGLHPIIAEPESQALARVVIPERDHGSVMIADIGLTRASFFLAYDHVVRFTSTVRDFSGTAVDAEIIKTGKVAVNDLAEFKQAYVFGSGDHPECDVALRPMMNALVSEMKKRLEYWADHEESAGSMNLHIPPANRVYLSGGESHLGGLPEYLSEALDIEVVRSSPWANVFNLDKYIPDISSHDMLPYAAALGLSANTPI